MGGAVSAVTKPITRLAGDILGKSPGGQAVNKEIDKRAEARASRYEEEQGAKMRGSRRRGRQLLSDARLNEAGTETLGGGQSLG